MKKAGLSWGEDMRPATRQCDGEVGHGHGHSADKEQACGLFGRPDAVEDYDEAAAAATHGAKVDQSKAKAGKGGRGDVRMISTHIVLVMREELREKGVGGGGRWSSCSEAELFLPNPGLRPFSQFGE